MTCVGIGEITDYINTSLSHFVKNLTVHLFTLLGALSPRKRGVVDRVLVSSQYLLGLL